MCSSIPGSARIDACRPLQTMWQYGSSEKTISSVPRTTSAIAARSSRVATPPVGLCGELSTIARGLGSVARKSLDILGRRPKLVFDLQGRQHRPRTAPLEVGHIGRKLGAEDQNPVARVEHRLGEELLERLGTRADHDVFGRHRIAEFGRDEPSRRRPELRQPQTRTVARLVFLDRPDARLLGVRRAGKRTVADLELDDVLSLGLEGPRDGQHGEGRLGRQVLCKMN